MSDHSKWTEDLFRQELAPILSRHMMVATGNPDAMAEIYETLASSLGTAVARLWGKLKDDGCYAGRFKSAYDGGCI